MRFLKSESIPDHFSWSMPDPYYIYSMYRCTGKHGNIVSDLCPIFLFRPKAQAKPYTNNGIRRFKGNWAKNYFFVSLRPPTSQLQLI